MQFYRLAIKRDKREMYQIRISSEREVSVRIDRCKHFDDRANYTENMCAALISYVYII